MEYITIKHANENNLKDVSVKIPLNEYVVFVGKSGSGKSTLVVNVITAGYINKNEYVTVPYEPLLFKQKAFIPNSTQSISTFLGIKDSDIIKHIKYLANCSEGKRNALLSIATILSLDKMDMTKEIAELNLTVYNKCRFIKLLLKHTNTLLIIDELGAGLSVSESYKIAKCFRILVENGYSILAVEHSLPIISKSDYIVELGPEAGEYGGEITFNGTIDEYKKTNNWECMTKLLGLPEHQISKLSKNITINNINYRLFKSMNISIPLNGIVTICGQSGSGKSSLLDIVYRACDKSASAWKNREGIDGSIEGKNNLRRPYLIDQVPIGNNTMSTPATYTSIMDSIRNIYLNQAEALGLSLNKSDFSYYSNGKCPVCNGKGSFEITTNDEIIFEQCKSCKGQRYNSKSLSVTESEITIGDSLQLSCQELFSIYAKDPKKKILSSKINFINQIGLAYLRLGQPSGSLSGGESQRIKITKELSKKLGDRCLFILDSPAKGLHMLDLPLVMNSLRKLVEKNNSVVIAENNPYFFKMSDWVIFLSDGKVIYSGIPSECPPTMYNSIKWE